MAHQWDYKVSHHRRSRKYFGYFMVAVIILITLVITLDSTTYQEITLLPKPTSYGLNVSFYGLNISSTVEPNKPPLKSNQHNSEIRAVKAHSKEFKITWRELDNGYITIYSTIKDTNKVETIAKQSLDIMHMKPLEFDPTFKNPCWYGNGKNDLFNDNKLHCLPYFYILGVKKSGTTDLFSRLSIHPQFTQPRTKEPQWFPRTRFRATLNKTSGTGSVDTRNVTFYIKMYDRIAKRIEMQTTQLNGTVYHQCVTADATPANLHMNRNWELLPGNENLSEPRFTNMNYIKHLVPNAKILIIFRDPVTRLFSDYLHLNTRNPKADKYVFHKHCVLLTTAYATCFQQHSTRECVYNNTLVRSLRLKGVELADSFMSSFYAVYMSDIYNTFDRKNVFPILSSEYISNMKNVLKDVFKFLDLYPLKSNLMAKALRSSVKNRSVKSRTVGPMLQTTEQLLYNFFEPHNRRMAELMDDDRYLFIKN